MSRKDREGLIWLGVCVLIVGSLGLLVALGMRGEKRRKAATEQLFDPVIQQVFSKWSAANLDGRERAKLEEPKKFRAGRVLPILIKGGKAKLCYEVLSNLPGGRRPSRPEEIETLLFIQYLGEHTELGPTFRDGFGTRRAQESSFNDCEYSLADISRPELTSASERGGTAATWVEDVPVQKIVDFVVLNDSFEVK